MGPRAPLARKEVLAAVRLVLDATFRQIILSFLRDTVVPDHLSFPLPIVDFAPLILLPYKRLRRRWRRGLLLKRHLGAVPDTLDGEKRAMVEVTVAILVTWLVPVRDKLYIISLTASIAYRTSTNTCNVTELFSLVCLTLPVKVVKMDTRKAPSFGYPYSRSYSEAEVDERWPKSRHCLNHFGERACYGRGVHLQISEASCSRSSIFSPNYGSN